MNIIPVRISEIYDAELEIHMLKQGDHYFYIDDLNKFTAFQLSKNKHVNIFFEYAYFISIGDLQ